MLGNIIFTALVNGSKIAFNVQPTFIATAFEGNIKKLKSEVTILYSLLDNKVITIDRFDE